MQRVPLSAPTDVAIVGSDLGLAVGAVVKNGWSGSAAYIHALRRLAPATLATTRTADSYCDYMTGNILTGSLGISADGTGVSVNGTKNGKLNGQSGTRFYASFVDFFTSTTPPSYFIF